MDLLKGVSPNDGDAARPRNRSQYKKKMALHACNRTTTEVVKTQMERVFEHYGLPLQISFENGAPWGSPSAPGRLTELGVWLVRLGIRISHSRPYHPQTNGKDERFHRSLKAEVLNANCFESFAHVQSALDEWRRVYNHGRPHDALELATPITRYRPSAVYLPKRLKEIEYAPQDEVRKVGWSGELRFKKASATSSAMPCRAIRWR